MVTTMTILPWQPLDETHITIVKQTQCHYHNYYNISASTLLQYCKTSIVAIGALVNQYTSTNT